MLLNRRRVFKNVYLITYFNIRITPVMCTAVDDQCTDVIKFQAARCRRCIMRYSPVGPVPYNGPEARTSTEVLFLSVLIHHVGHCKFGEFLSVFELKNI